MQKGLLIVISAPSGSGKSTVGRLLHAEGFEFIDTDAEIEKAKNIIGRSVFLAASIRSSVPD